MAPPEYHCPVRVAVIGVGRMGSRHALALARLRDRGAGVTLAGVADRNPARARSVAAATESVGLEDYRSVFPSADAVIVAVPTQCHFEVVQHAFEAGLHVLVEKPCCATVEQAEILCRQARHYDRVLQVGHLEWFNPAWQAVVTFAERPRRIVVKRIGPFSPGGADVDVVFDVMIHDIHLIQVLLGEEPVEIDATGRTEFGGTADVARARLIFPGGCVATLLASRAASRRERICRMRGHSTVTTVDFIEQSVTVHEGVTSWAPAVGRRDLIDLQIPAFVSAIHSRPAAAVQAPAVLGAMRTAQRISERLSRSARLGLSVSGDRRKRITAAGGAAILHSSE